MRHGGDAVQDGSAFVLCHQGDNHGAAANGDKWGGGVQHNKPPSPTQRDTG